MCGIAGYLNLNSGSGAKDYIVNNMVSCLNHRGPDDSGLFVAGPLAIAHRRLAILDKTIAGHQPMSTPDGRHTIVFNGEVYNFKDLKYRYLKDVKFKSTSDTEVLLHLLARQGTKALGYLRGMFAFALWDKQKNELLLGRDPFGKKPLYYIHQPGLFAFASEIKSLFHHPDIAPAPDHTAITKFLLYEYVPSPATGFVGIKHLPMGHWLTINESGKEKLENWWTPRTKPKLSFTSDREAANQLYHLLSVAVKRRLVADVPVGVLLSGGLDSTTITALMRELIPGKFHSYSMSFDESTFDESSYARLASKTFDTQHHDIHFGLNEFHSSFVDVTAQLDIPLADVSLLPTYVLSKYAKQEITVALDGDGSDELFAGYGTFTAATVADKVPPIPAVIWDGIEKIARLMPTSDEYFSLDFKIKSFFRGMRYPRAIRNQVWLGSFTDRELGTLLTPVWRKNISRLFEDIKALSPITNNLHTVDVITVLTIFHYLQNDILVKLDRSSMYVGLEARTPFLDLDVAEFALHLPDQLKHNKNIIKIMMEGKIPKSIISRPKQGFGIPLGKWLRGPLQAWSCDMLNQDILNKAGIVQAPYVNKLLAEHFRGKADHRKKIWTLIMLHHWYNKYF